MNLAGVEVSKTALRRHVVKIGEEMQAFERADAEEGAPTAPTKNALLAVKCCLENRRWADFLDWRACRVATLAQKHEPHPEIKQNVAFQCWYAYPSYVSRQSLGAIGASVIHGAMAMNLKHLPRDLPPPI